MGAVEDEVARQREWLAWHNAAFTSESVPSVVLVRGTEEESTATGHWYHGVHDLSSERVWDCVLPNIITGGAPYVVMIVSDDPSIVSTIRALPDGESPPE